MQETTRQLLVRPRATRRRVLGFAALGALGALTGCGAAGSSGRPTRAPQKVALTFPGPGVVFIPLEAAIGKGFFAEEGITIDASYARGGPQVIAAIRSKSVDFIGTTIDLQLASIKEAGEQPLTMVTSLTHLPPFAIVARKDVSGLPALVGQPLGVFNLGSGDQVIVEYLLRRGGVDPKTVKFVPLGADSAKVAALTKGEVAAVVVGEPARTLLAKRGMTVLVDLFDPAQARTYFDGGYQFTGLVTRPEVIAGQADLVQRMVNAAVRGDDFVAKHSGAEIANALRDVAIVGGDRAQYGAVLQGFKNGLFAPDGRIDPAQVERVKEIQRQSGILSPAAAGLDMAGFYSNQFVEAYWKAPR